MMGNRQAQFLRRFKSKMPTSVSRTREFVRAIGRIRINGSETSLMSSNHPILGASRATMTTKTTQLSSTHERELLCFRNR